MYLVLFAISLVSVFGQSPVALEVLKNMDFAVDPCNDFYHYACGNWIKNTTLPPSKPALFRSFSEIQDRNQEALLQVVQSPSNPKLNNFYSTCMNVDAINARGAAPMIKYDLSLVSQVQDAPSLFQVLGQLYLKGIFPFFRFASTIDSGDPTRVIGAFDQGGLGLPYPAMYYEESSATIREEYLAHLTTMFTLIQDTYPAASAKMVMDMETEIAIFSTPSDELTDPFTTYNPMSLAEFKQLTPDLPWEFFFMTLNLTDTVMSTVTLSVPTFFGNLSGRISLSETSWIPYLRWNIIRSRAALLDDAFRTEHFNFFSKILRGQKSPAPLWRQCIAWTDSSLGELLGKEFVKLTFPGTSEIAAEDALTDILAAMKNDLDTITWMDTKTRDLAIQKLELVSHLIGQPTDPDNYTGVIVSTGFFENIESATSYAILKDLSYIGGPSSTIKNAWGMTPSTVNAYYDPTKNQMVFPAGIMQPPFFSRVFPVEMNLGGIGMVMGHELTHGFDNQGRLYNGQGKLTNWWSTATNTQFEDRVDCVINQYSGFEVLPGIYINGKLTQGENIADMGGIKNAFMALKTLIDINQISIVSPLTRGQLFFVGFAQSWCAVESDAYVKLQVKTDPHSPAQFRVLGPLMDFPEFATLWGCPVGSKMNPAKRCEVW